MRMLSVRYRIFAQKKCSPCHRPQVGGQPSDCRQPIAFGKVATVVEPSAVATAVGSPANIYDTICPKCWGTQISGTLKNQPTVIGAPLPPTALSCPEARLTPASEAPAMVTGKVGLSFDCYLLKLSCTQNAKCLQITWIDNSYLATIKDNDKCKDVEDQTSSGAN